MPITEILQVNRSFLLSRVKCNIDKGDYDAAAEYYEKNLRLATLLQERCGSFVDDNLLKDLPGLSPEAFAHALKREYSYCKEAFKLNPVDIGFPREPDFAKLLLAPIARYACHPNRCLCVVAEHIRNVIQSEVLPCEEGNH